MLRRNRRTAFGTRTWLGLCALGACTQPTFPTPDAGPEDTERTREDAATPDARVMDLPPPEAAVEAGSEPADADLDAEPRPPLPESASDLLGRYVRRSTFFHVDRRNNLVARGVEYALVEFAPDGQGGITMYTDLCDVTVDNAFSFVIHIKDPAVLSALQQPVLFEADGSFHVTTSSAFQGYEPERADELGCTGAGVRKPRADDQTWDAPGDSADANAWNTLKTCSCPAILTEPPTVVTDCRLVDDDGDGMPGMTATAGPAPVPGGEVEWPMTLEESLGIVRATVTPDHTIDAVELHGIRVSCLDPDSLCSPAPTTACAPEKTEVLFLYLDAALDCAGVIASAEQLFPTAPPRFPSADDCL